MYINVSIRNLLNCDSKFKKYFSYYKPISKNKNLEIETSYCNYEFFKFELDCHWIGSDHAGIHFDLNVLGWELSFKIYDSRHWDYENWRWEESK